MARAKRALKHILLGLAAATLLAAVACTDNVSHGWKCVPEKSKAQVGERIPLGIVKQHYGSGCVGEREYPGPGVDAGDVKWEVNPKTGRVVGGVFVADAPGAYTLHGTFKAPDDAIEVGGMQDSTLVNIDVVEQGASTSVGSSSTNQGDDEFSVDSSSSASSTPAGADPLAGTWTYKGRLVRGDGADAKWSDSPNQGVLVIDKTADGFKLEISDGTSSVKFDGTNVVLVRDFPSLKVKVIYKGTLSGDTITGTQHNTARGSSDDSPWVAKRSK